MDDVPVITRVDLLPLLSEGWSGPEAAWRAIERCSPLIKRVVASQYAKSGRWCRSLEDQGDLLTYTVCDLIESADRKQGLSLPPGWDQPDLSCWFASVVRNQAISVLRRLGRQERERLTREGDTDSVGGLLLGPTNAPDTSGELLDVQRAHEAIRELLERPSVPPVQALAWVLLSRPRWLSRDLVEAASGLVHQGHPGTKRGLVRSPDETWALLCDWLPRHALNPRGQGSRRELAWILRSSDPHSPEHWRLDKPADLHTALDTLRKWENRFRPLIWKKLIRDGLEEGTP